jgi:hypothetical protein
MLKNRINKELEQIQTQENTVFEDRKEKNANLIDLYYIPKQNEIKTKKSFFKWKSFITISASLVIMLSLIFIMPSSEKKDESYHGVEINNIQDLSIEELQTRIRNDVLKNIQKFNLINNILTYEVVSNETAYYTLIYSKNDLSVEVTVIEKLEYKVNFNVLKDMKDIKDYKNNHYNYKTTGNIVIVSYETSDKLVFIKYPENNLELAIDFLIEVI